jgi:hypothetical protein
MVELARVQASVQRVHIAPWKTIRALLSWEELLGGEVRLCLPHTVRMLYRDVDPSLKASRGTNVAALLTLWNCYFGE